ncbi:hypothetical protein PTTG_08358 [Puccinia triticina 1-1 BBBD Race 1]|uniref:L-2-hydroxyglutarate dehydrogenase, mitochondrial n=2 Tax=Puccinia triticina TaxID=208348 RepID=A0A180GE06_PUCT1|nr:uncharacterized protein PtA15_4A379 [Puccinia triticina]OAV90173.1 hypothetical protein PTTG_08358 [Puccinia triticina 1-1 BBBD Race 1]WAQ83929.1 hypothetical protein PtA15_4A379 [Puccinia triticina]WAR54777.1 hypothetical protein PtB15_4B395 [Puccinia triticina]
MAMASKTVSRLRQNFAYIPPEASVDHMVIGAGVVGLAIGRELVNKFRSRSTFVVERNPQPGQETSSRNSEVIHAGIYYPQDSLKTAMCLRGRKLLYEYCRKHDVPHKKIGKLIISRSQDETDYLQKLYKKCQRLNRDKELTRAVMFGRMEDRDEELAPLRVINQAEALSLEPNLSQDVRFGLFSPETGVLDSHAFISSLENSIENSENGEVVYGTHVVRIDRCSNDQGWVVQTQTNADQPGDAGGERNSVLAKCLVNCAGLNAHNIYNHILYPSSRQLQMGFCKGSYYSYGSRKGVNSVKHLIYPTPIQQPRGESFVGLGTHLTLDMNQKIKFGPDVEWLTTKMVQSNPSFLAKSGPAGLHGDALEELQDFWTELLSPNDQRLETTFQSVQSYLPGVDIDHFSPDYSGIRPKLRTTDGLQNEANQEVLSGNTGAEENRRPSLDDFYIRQPEPGFVNLLGIESPGLTSSLAIAEHVAKLVQELPHGLSLKTRHSTAHERFSAVGQLDDWA